jgi:hypothetical protein
MKMRWIRAAIVAAAAAAGSVDAGAQMMGPGGGMMGGFFASGVSRGTGYFGTQASMGSIASAWLSQLHAALQITAQQEQAWQGFANAATSQATAMQSFRNQMLLSTAGTAPQRATLAEQFMEQRLDAMRATTDALTALYAQLTPAQRAILDQGYALQCGPWGLFGD